MTSVTQTISGDGVLDLAANRVITDIIGYVTATTPYMNTVDPTSHAFISRFGFIALGSPNLFSGSWQTYWQAPLWIHNMYFAFDFEGTNETTVQYVRWHLFYGHTAELQVYY